MASKEQVVKAISRLASVYPDYSLTADTLAGYYEVLRGYKAPDLEEAITACMATYVSFPSVAAIVRCIPRPKTRPRQETIKPGPFKEASKELIQGLLDKVEAMPEPEKPKDGWSPEKKQRFREPQRMPVDAEKQAATATRLSNDLERLGKAAKGKVPMTDEEMQTEADREWRKRLLLASETKERKKK